MAEDQAQEPVRRMGDGTPCWCVTDGGDSAEHSPRCLTLRALSGGYDFADQPDNQGPRRNVTQKQKKAAFLRTFRTDGIKTRACDEVGVHPTTVTRWVESDEAFANEYQVAIDTAADVLVKEAQRRALEGTLKPVYQGGKKVGEVREYSDVLLIFLLKGERPGKYRDNAKIEVSGPNGSPLLANMAGMSDHEKQILRRVLDGAIAAAASPVAPGASPTAGEGHDGS